MTVHTVPQQCFLGIKPLLIQEAVERTGDDHIPGGYCVDQHVWMVDGSPIVKAQSALAEMTTKTKAHVESDDMSDISLLELQTKTNAQIESDDQSFEINLLGLTTKTFADAERDD